MLLVLITQEMLLMSTIIYVFMEKIRKYVDTSHYYRTTVLQRCNTTELQFYILLVLLELVLHRLAGFFCA